MGTQMSLMDEMNRAAVEVAKATDEDMTTGYFREKAAQLAREIRNKEKGKALAAAGEAGEDLEAFRLLADIMWDDVWSAMGSIGIDDVRYVADAMKVPYTPGNWMGSVFSKGWRFAEFTNSTYPGCHARVIRRWRK
jgi:hypothetical protein